MREKRFSLVPIISTILKVLAVLIVLFFVYQSILGFIAAVSAWQGGIGQFGQEVPPVTGIWDRLASLLSPLFNLIIGLLIGAATWGFAELFQMVRQILLHLVPHTTSVDEEPKAT